mgnify:CR=1 FL=1
MTQTRTPSPAGAAIKARSHAVKSRSHATGVRTCAACRSRLAARDLVRFTRDGGSWTCVVPGTPQHGRGVSLCPQSACFERACTSRKSRFACEHGRPAVTALLGLAIEAYRDRIRLLRRSGGLGPAEILEPILSQLSNALLTLPPGRSGETHVR